MSDEKTNSDGLPACTVQYVRQVLRKMRYRRKVRDEVKAELMAHFEDELEDCKSGEEKEEKAREILTEFGDMKLLAILLRRAKKRCRPLWRIVAERTFQAIGVLIVCFIFYAVWFSSGEPIIRMDYIRQLDLMNQPQIRNEDNAWPHYEKAINLYVQQGPLVEQFISYRNSGKKRQETLRLKNLINARQVQKWLKNNQNHWDGFSPEQRAAVLKYFEYNWVPFPDASHRACNQWQATTFQQMTEHILTCIGDKAELTIPLPHGALPDLKEPGYPYSELKSWQAESRIPPNFLEAVSVAVLREGMNRYKEPLEDSWSPITDTEFEYISPWIKQNEEAWREFTAGALKPYCYKAYQYDPNSGDHWSLGFGVPQMLRKLASLGIWNSRLDIKQGHIQQGIEDCLMVARAGSHWQGKGRISQQFSGQSLSNLASQEILRIVATQDLAATDLRQLQQQLSPIYPEGYPRMNMETEKLAFLDTIQRVFTEDGFGGGHLIPDRYMDIFEPWTYEDSEAKMFSLPLTTIAGMIHARRDETIRKGNMVLEKYSQICKMTPYEKYTGGVSGDEKYWSLPREKYFLIYRSMRDIHQVSKFTYLSEAWYKAAITTLAIKRWRLEKNAYPETLSELTAAGFLDEIPMDLYSDKPLVYKKTEDDFVLYSVGRNFTDDNGEVAVNDRGEPQNWGTPEAGDIVFWPIAK